ncbi:serine/threonine protein kinase [bacterium]|nr:serine/threonine protein kinase [bacterium]
MDDYLKPEIKAVSEECQNSDKPFVFSIDLPPQYEILAELGHGGMGTVYQAKNRHLGNFVAIKVINPELLEGKNETKANALKRFFVEAKAISQLSHENLVALKDFGVTPEGAAFIVMDYVDGKTLEDLVKSGPLDYKAVLETLLGVCDALECAHQSGVVHRDIKSANIIIAKNSRGIESPKLLDFGIARIAGDDGKTQGLTSTGEIFGSPLYIAPEQSMSSKVDGRADIYSLGCVLFECLTGQPPFKGETAIHTIMMHLNAPVPSLISRPGQELPRDLAIIVERCLEKEPANRYQSAAELRSDIESVLAGRQLKPKMAAKKKVSRKKQIAFSLVATILIGGSLVSLIGLNSLNRANQTVNNKTAKSSDLAKFAIEKDMRDAMAAFNRGDYMSSIHALKGSISIYEDLLRPVETALAKRPTGAALKELERQRWDLLWAKAENFRNIGDCYVGLGDNEQAAGSYEKGVEILREWVSKGYCSKPMEQIYNLCIASLQKAGRTADAQKYQEELDRCLKTKGLAPK